MRIVIAPDSFKESMTAPRAARAMAEGAAQALPGCRTELVPVSDGGEGFSRAVAQAWGARWVEAPCCDALGRPLRAGFGLDGRRAVLDLASCAGLELIDPRDRDVMRSSTRGLGLLLGAALEAGARQVLIGLGGSATNDMGLGMLAGLGARLLDARGLEVDPVPAQMPRIASMDLAPARRRLEGARLTVACDVTNPLCGPRGATHVFGAQKGVEASRAPGLDAELARLAALCGAPEAAGLPGAGAAGGAGFALAGLLGAEMVPGIDCLARSVGLSRRLIGADLCLSGEGRLDAQSLQGKATSGVCRLAARAGVPVLLFAGAVEQAGLIQERTGAARVIAISDPREPLGLSLAQGPERLRRAVARALGADGAGPEPRAPGAAPAR